MCTPFLSCRLKINKPFRVAPQTGCTVSILCLSVTNRRYYEHWLCKKKDCVLLKNLPYFDDNLSLFVRFNPMLFWIIQRVDFRTKGHERQIINYKNISKRCLLGYNNKITWVFSSGLHPSLQRTTYKKYISRPSSHSSMILFCRWLVPKPIHLTMPRVYYSHFTVCHHGIPWKRLEVWNERERMMMVH